MSHDNDPAKVVLKTALATIEGKYTAHGLELDVKVSPCSWMYQGYGFQAEYTGADCHGFVNDQPLAVEAATRADVQRLLDALPKGACTRCSKPYVRDAHTAKYRGTLCEPCWMDDFNKRCKAEEEKERKSLERQDARMLKKGYTHRVSAWVHPSGGGDDYLLDFYSKGEPTKEDVRRLLQKKGSRVFDDYGVVKLDK